MARTTIGQGFWQTIYGALNANFIELYKLKPAPVALTYSATMTIDAAENGSIQSIDLTGNVVIGFANIENGQTVDVYITNNSGMTRSLSVPIKGININIDNNKRSRLQVTNVSGGYWVNVSGYA